MGTSNDMNFIEYVCVNCFLRNVIVQKFRSISKIFPYSKDIATYEKFFILAEDLFVRYKNLF